MAALVLAAPAARAELPAYVGSAVCAPCHAAEHAAWQGSQHAVAMQEATGATVLGRFDGATFTHAGVTSTFSRRDGTFVVRTEGPDGALADFPVPYVFGVFPLQQYLLPLPGGRLQALGVAWDARPDGQRWFHLYPEDTPKPGDPLHWTGIDQSWNYQCADCHSTNLRKNYDAATRTFATTWSEISVGCEACHGPGERHVAWAREPAEERDDADRGLPNALDERRGVVWTRAGDAPTAARSAPRTTSREIDTCGRCHARRQQFSDEHAAGMPLHDAFRPARLEPGLFHPDGQQRDEVYTWASFLQSRMAAVGVTCADCHDPHTQKLRAPGDAVCATCHAPAAFAVRAHHHHEPGSAGASCVACHMPATTYMRIDPRRDHSLRIPRPDRAVRLGTPDACTRCHTDETASWAAAAVARWYPEPKPGFQTFAEAFHLAEQDAPGARAALRAVARDGAHPPVVRATAVARLGEQLRPETLPAVTAALRDEDPDVRAAAVAALTEAPPAIRLTHLPPLLADGRRLVRMDAARALAGEPEAGLSDDDRTRFAAALDEWVAAQRFNAERPEAHANLGMLALARGDRDAALAELRTALALDPSFSQAAVNLADVQRGAGQETDAEATLRAALRRTPDAAAVHHALGLALVRQRRLPEALEALGRAAALAPEQPRFAWVYGVALHDTGDRAGAVRALSEALARHPYDRDLLSTLVSYEREAGQMADALARARVLQELEPDDAGVAALVRQLEAASGTGSRTPPEP